MHIRKSQIGKNQHLTSVEHFKKMKMNRGKEMFIETPKIDFFFRDKNQLSFYQRMKKLNTIQYNCINQATMQNEKKNYSE